MSSKVIQIQFPSAIANADFRVSKIFVQAGSKVIAGEVLLEVTSEQDKLRIKAPRAGLVRNLSVTEGQVITPRMLLLSIDVAEQPLSATPETSEDLNNSTNNAIEPEVKIEGLSFSQRLFEKLLRWSILGCAALLSYVLLISYSGKPFWMLLAIHASVTIVLLLLVVRLLSRALFLPVDEAISGLFVYLLLLSIFNFNQSGNIVAAPTYTIWAPITAPLLDYQQTLFGDGDGSRVGQSDQGKFDSVLFSMQNGADNIGHLFSDLTRRVNYGFVDDGSWDTVPMQTASLLSKLQVPRLKLYHYKNQSYAAMRLHNTSNVSLLNISAKVRIANRELGELKFVADKPVLPGESAEFIAPLSKDIIDSVSRRYDNVLVWINDDQAVQFTNAKTEVFDRKVYFERNVDAWLEN